MKITPISGSPEFLPAQRIVEQHFLDVIRETFELHGFPSIETRAVEPVDRLVGKGGDADTGVDDHALLARGGREDVAVGVEGSSGKGDGQHGPKPNDR